MMLTPARFFAHLATIFWCLFLIIVSPVWILVVEMIFEKSIWSFWSYITLFLVLSVPVSVIVALCSLWGSHLNSNTKAQVWYSVVPFLVIFIVFLFESLFIDLKAFF
jgi:hypothetical protein